LDSTSSPSSNQKHICLSIYLSKLSLYIKPTTTINMSSSKPQTQFNPFLTLAPATSASYPQTPASRAVAGDAAVAPVRPVQRRSSSVSSAGSFKVLKLGPVHWGEHPDEHKEDFHEVAVSPWAGIPGMGQRAHVTERREERAAGSRLAVLDLAG
jgi:hypothetical protein